MSVAEPEAHEAGAFAAPVLATRALFLASPWAAAGLVALAIAQQLAGHLDCDVSWFITFAEKFVDGRVPYVEVTDPNPPAAFLAFVPAVLLARALRIAAEPVVAAFVFAFAGLCIAFTGYVLRYGPSRSRLAWGLLRNGALYLLLVVPEIAFAEREHLALLAMAPMLAALAVGGTTRLPFAARVAAGLGAAVAMSFKPYFALAIALPALAIVWRERSPRVLFGVEMWTAAIALLGYVAAVLIFFPAYWAYALPLIVDVYAPVHESVQTLALRTPAPAYAALLIGLGFAARGLVLGRATLVAVAASMGFFVSFVMQGKGWINHAYPGLALILFAWALFALDELRLPSAPLRGTRERLVKFLFVPAFCAAPAFFGVINQVADIEEHKGLRAAIARLAPAHPRMIAMARQLDFGHPVVRQVGGQWVGRQNALWASSFVAQLMPDAASDPSYRARLENYRHEDLAAFAEDVRKGRPDVILVENKATREFVSRRPETSGILDHYDKGGTAGEIEIWLRKMD